MNAEIPEYTPAQRESFLALEVAVKQILGAMSEEQKIEVVNGTMWTYPVMLGRDSQNKPEYAMVFLSLRKEDVELKAKAAR